jgi:integrase
MDYSPRKIDIKLLRQIVKATPPERPQEIRDSAQGLVLRHQPSGHASLYAVAGRGQRKQICKATDIVDDTLPQTLRWAINEARKFQGKAAAGELEPRALKQQIPTLRQFLTGGDKGRCFSEAVRPLEIQRLVAAFPDLLDRPLDKIVPLDLARWTRHRISAGMMPSSTLRMARMINSALERAVEWKIINANPISRQIRSKKSRIKIADIGLEAIEHRVRFLSDDEEQRLRAVLQRRRGYLQPAVLVSMHTGLRRGELAQLTWACIDFASKVITVKATTAKSGKARHVPMNDEVIELLRGWRSKDAQPTDFVFTTRRGMPITTTARVWKNLMREASITNFRWHDLRHVFASKLVMRGVDLYVVKELLGHSSIMHTQIYAHLMPGKHHDAVARLV